MKIRKATEQEMLSLWGYKNMDSVSPTTLFFAQNISSGNAEFWTLNDNGQIIGELYIFWELNDKDFADGKSRAYLCAFRIKSEYRKKGYGRKLIEFVCQKYKKDFSAVQVGTGDSPLTVPFYQKCGFVKSHVVKNFFIDNYDHPIIEDGVRLVDMIYLKKTL